MYAIMHSNNQTKHMHHNGDLTFQKKNYYIVLNANSDLSLLAIKLVQS